MRSSLIVAMLMMLLHGCDSSSSSTARRYDPCVGPGVLPEVPNEFELQWGATNTNAAIGSGAMTATLSACGELTSVKWPGPSQSDQLAYLTDNSADARLKPHFGALDSAGAFPGLAYRAGGQPGFTWLRDAEWFHEQSYAGDESDVVVTRMTNDDLGLVITARQFILPERDVLVSQYSVERRPESSVSDATLILYTNFDPVIGVIPYLQIADWALDFRNDYAVAYDSRERALIHFLPQEARNYPHDFSRLNPLLANPTSEAAVLQAQVDELVDSLTGSGVFIAVAAKEGDDGFQCGFDETDLCRRQSEAFERTVLAFNLDDTFKNFVRYLYNCAAVVPDPAGPLSQCRAVNGWQYTAASAYEDAADGQLSRSPLAACQANGALSRQLSFDAGHAEATFYMAIAATRDDAYGLLREARAQRVDDQIAATEDWWADFLSSANLPATDDEGILTFAKRSLIAMRTATDNASGAIVASVNTQPPYGADWPRDGAFINYALDLAGYSELVTHHNEFYTRVQRKRPSGYSPLFDFGPCDPNAPIYPNCVPAGTFEANYYGLSAATVPALLISFEIDETALAVWTMLQHVEFLASSSERAAYLNKVCPAVRLAANSLANCRDPETGLQCIANEDDNIPQSQGLLGAETVLLALRSAVDAPAECEFPLADVAAWHARAVELDRAILEHFVVQDPIPHFGGGSREGWMLWPLMFRGPDDALMRSHDRFLHQRYVQPILDRSAPTFAYNTESLLSRAQFARARGDETELAEIREQVRFFVRELTTVGTHHLSEAAGRIDFDINGDGVRPDYLPQNDVPHIWEHAYLYAAAMVAFGN